MIRVMIWRHDIDALAFQPDDYRGHCLIHRRAFRTLLRFSPTPEDCETFFHAHEDAFRAAATAKILRAKVLDGANFHLTSRDVARQLKK